jgi:hypothetical protein
MIWLASCILEGISFSLQNQVVIWPGESLRSSPQDFDKASKSVQNHLALIHP